MLAVLAGGRIQDRPSRDAESREGVGEHRCLLANRGVDAGTAAFTRALESLEPVHLTSDRLQAQRVLQIDPEVTAAIEILRRSVRGDHDAGHVLIRPRESSRAPDARLLS